MKSFPFVLVLGALLLGACAGAVPWNPQGNAGITKVDVEWCESEEAQKGYTVCDISFVDGKEKNVVELTIKHPSGVEVTYKAGGVRAFEAHAVRAAVEEAVSDDVVRTVPGVVEAIVDAIMGL